MSLRPREVQARFHQLLKQFSIVCLLGPRQCGKTTFAKMELPEWRYVDLEKPSDLTRLSEDPEGALKHWKGKVVFDEAQRLPALFPLLRSYVDEQGQKKGSFVLLGSASFDLVRNISESLAGRVGFLDMTPFQLHEVDFQKELWLRGGFPLPYSLRESAKRQDWFEGYVRTFLERDLRELGINVSSSQMRRLWSMLSHVHGGLLNESELGASMGISYHTVHRYIDILEQTFLVRRLPSYFVNIQKRLTKAPKIYIRDSGLLHYFLNISDRERLENHPKKGASWEGFVIEQVSSILSLHHPGIEFFFWRTAIGQEVDLILKKGSKILPIEIKLHTSPGKSDVKGLFSCLSDLSLSKGYVIRPEGESYSLGSGVTVFSLKEFLENTMKFF